MRPSFFFRNARLTALLISSFTMGPSTPAPAPDRLQG
jgi:hypothetical protein